jgi:hypothetical protein
MRKLIWIEVRTPLTLTNDVKAVAGGSSARTEYCCSVSNVQWLGIHNLVQNGVCKAAISRETNLGDSI